MPKKIIIIILSLAGILTASALMLNCDVLSVMGFPGKITIVVDPGHGGLDGGAKSASGICEKDINLQIAQMVKENAESQGFRVIMTRNSDEGLYSEGRGSIRSKKNEDLHKRQQIINGSGVDCAVSIHLNSFPSQSVHGAQIFYPKNSEESRKIAEILQNGIREELDRENEREALPKEDIIIMKNNKVPMILVECGFISNRNEEAKLCRKSYQKKVADLIVLSLKKYFIETGKIAEEKIVVVDSVNNEPVWF